MSQIDFIKILKPLISVILDENEIEIQFFGKEESQIIKKNGVFEEVNGGTLFLKNIECLSSKNQGKLLRVFEDKKYRRIGGRFFQEN